MKTKEEYTKLTEEELAKVSGGVGPMGSGGGGYTPGAPSTPSSPSDPTESYTVPVKGEDTDHIDY